MSNMSHCRFNNTKIDVDDCLDAIDNQAIRSKSELKEAKQMFLNFLNFCEDNCIIETFNTEALEEMIQDAFDSNSD